MDLKLGGRAREIGHNSYAPLVEPIGDYGPWALKLSPGPHLFTDWRYVLAGDVWGGFHWASKETDEVLPVRVRDADGQFVDGPVDARMVPEDVPRGIRIVAQKARKGEPFPLGGPPGGRILCSEGRYQTWYHPRHPWAAQSSKFEGTLYHAESTDGHAWGQPSECVFDWSAAPDVNAGEPPTAFLDPSAPPEERYKLVFLGSSTAPEHQERREQALEAFLRDRSDVIDPTGLGMLPEETVPRVNFGRYGAVSPDGIHWKVLPEILMILRSDAQNIVYYDTVRERYVWYLKTEWYAGRRCIGRAETADFRRWPLPEMILFPGPDLHPSDDWYTNSKTIYPGTDAHHLMFPALYHHLTDDAEVRLFTSSDGVSWSAVPGGAVISQGEPGAWDTGFLTAGIDLVPLPGDQVGIPFGASYYPHKYPRTKETVSRQRGAYALWPKERLVALEAQESGSFTTLPLVFTGRKLRLNVQTSMAGEVLVEATATRPRGGGGGDPLPGRSFADCVPIVGDSLDHIVTWKGGQDLAPMGAQPITLRFRMRAAKLFAFEFV